MNFFYIAIHKIRGRKKLTNENTVGWGAPSQRDFSVLRSVLLTVLSYKVCLGERRGVRINSPSDRSWEESCF